MGRLVRMDDWDTGNVRLVSIRQRFTGQRTGREASDNNEADGPEGGENAHRARAVCISS